MSDILLAATGWDAAGWAERLRARLPGRQVSMAGRDGSSPLDLDASAIAYLLAWKPRRDILRDLPALQAIFSLGAGVDHLFGLDPHPTVPVVRIVDPDLTARMTEYVVWQVLHHHRRGPLYARQQAGRVWREHDQPAASEVTVGIMGLGVLGRAAAGALLAIGFPVRGWTRSPTAISGVRCFSGPDELDAFLGRTDILVSLLPLTPETAGIIDRRLIARLRLNGPLGGPVLINAGRGGSQVEADVAAAIREGMLAGASLDVFTEEPLSGDSPLWSLPNVVITPHIAAASDPAALVERIAAQIEAFERGEILTNLVDPTRGY